MMFPGDIHFLVRKQQYEEALQQVARERMVRASQRPLHNGKLHLKAARWIGIHMVKWGSKLEQSSTTTLCGLKSSDECTCDPQVPAAGTCCV
jgi:hypothetical protein